MIPALIDTHGRMMYVYKSLTGQELDTLEQLTKRASPPTWALLCSNVYERHKEHFRRTEIADYLSMIAQRLF